MNHKMFNQKDDIIQWLQDMNIRPFVIKEDLTIYARDVDLQGKNLTYLPVQFSEIEGNFDCSDNALTSLKGSPLKLTGSFFCHNNQLTDLIGSPQIITGDFKCYNNNLITLSGGPIHVSGVYYCSLNYITHINGAPQSAAKFDIMYNPIHLEEILTLDLDTELICSIKSDDKASNGQPIFEILQSVLGQYEEDNEKYLRQNLKWLKSYYLSQKMEFDLAIKSQTSRLNKI